jgi:hypothetical protein
VKKLLSSPESIEEGYKEFVVEREKQNEPIISRMSLIEDLIAENQQQLDRLIDLYLLDEFPQSAIIERKVQIENTIQSLRNEWNNMDATITESEIKEDQIVDLKKFVSEVSDGIKLIENDFSAKQKIIDLLDVQVTLTLENSEKIIYAKCILKEKSFPIAHTSTNTSPLEIQ